MRSSFSVLQVLATVLAVTEAQGPPKNGAVSTGGSGKYKAGASTEASLPKHTIYAPKTPPAGEKLPLITWGNSGCAPDGVGFATFLSEIASHGYVIIVSGQGSNFRGGQSTNKDMADSIDWAVKNPAAAKYNIDTNRISTSGQSCGGLQALHIGVEDSRVKLITIFNSGSLNAKDTAAAKQVKVPIAYFLGGSKDIAFKNGEKDYAVLPPNVPALLASINSGHMGTYFQTDGGTYGKAAVAWFNWQFKNDAAGKALFLNPGASALTKDGWTIKSRNFK